MSPLSYCDCEITKCIKSTSLDWDDDVEFVCVKHSLFFVYYAGMLKKHPHYFHDKIINAYIVTHKIARSRRLVILLNQELDHRIKEDIEKTSLFAWKSFNTRCDDSTFSVEIEI